VQEEKIYHMAGRARRDDDDARDPGRHPRSGPVAVERDTLYNVIDN